MLGTFYAGDSYIVLHVRGLLLADKVAHVSQTYTVRSDSEELAHDLHFWLGRNTSTDEAGTAAYKTVELDDRE
jgi:gelsolin